MTEQEFRAGQDFLLAAKRFWMTSLYRQVRAEAGVTRPDREAGASSRSLTQVARALEPSTTYRYFGWLERHLQRLKYSGAYGLVPYFDERRMSHLRALDTATQDDPCLMLDPDLVLPRYYTGIDIHGHPGGVWSDAIAGLVYEHGAQSTTPMLGDAHESLHTRFTDLVAAEGMPKRMLDLGCGFGKSTRPFAQAFPDAQIDAVDLAAPCLRVAAYRARGSQGARTRYLQRDATATGLADAGYDLVTSTMLLHELPVERIEALFAEAYRLLEPGGRMVHLDFYSFPDGFTRFMHYGHGRRNNEPYMEPLAELDLEGLLRSKGFEDIRIEPFREAEGVDLEGAEAWRFPWTVIRAIKPLRADRSRHGAALRRTSGGKPRDATGRQRARTRVRRGAG